MNQGLAFAHQRVRRLRRLLCKRTARWAERAFVAEGPELVRSALSSGVAVESLYVGAGAGASEGIAAVVEDALRSGARVFDLAKGVLERVADTVTPQPLLAILPMLDVSLAGIGRSGLVVVCAEVRDPGNAGTVLRSADASGAAAVIFCGKSVDPYNPKAVRASAGSLFHVPFVVAKCCEEALRGLAGSGYRLLGAAADGQQDYAEVAWTKPTAVVLGSETAGLSVLDRGLLESTVRIPMAGKAESLNIGVACAVLCFEALRHRRATLRSNL